MSRLVCLMVLILVLGFSAGADVIVSQPPLDQGFAWLSDFASSEEVVLSDDFSFTGISTFITGIRWWGAYSTEPDPVDDNFVIDFYDGDAVTGPAEFPLASFAPGAVTRVATSMTALPTSAHDGGIVYEYTFDLPVPLLLAPDTVYFLSIANDTFTGDFGAEQLLTSGWGWLEDGPGTFWSFFYTGSHEWLPTDAGHNLAFELLGREVPPDGVIPEPGTLVLFGMVMGFMAVRRLRSR